MATYPLRSPPLTRSRTQERLERLDQDQGSVQSTPAIRALQLEQDLYQNPESVMARTASRPVHSTSPSSARLEGRKRFRQLEDHCRRTNELPPLLQYLSGLFDILADDTILAIMHLLVEIPITTRVGLELHNVVHGGGCALRNLLLSCKRMFNVLKGPGTTLDREMAARAATQIAPPLPSLTPYPFTEQLRTESRSSDQLEVLRSAVAAMAVHCANACCSKAQNDFNRRGKRIVVTARRSAVVAAVPSGSTAFISSRERRDGVRVVKQREHNRVAGEQSTRMTTEWIHQLRNDGTLLRSVQLTDLGQFGAPHTMRVCQHGHRVALIRNVYTQHADESIPHSVVMVWDTVGAPNGLSEILEPPAEAEGLGAINAQDAWWLQDSTLGDQKQLVVLWSTAYVHPMGTVVGANADNACYFLAVYAMEHTPGEVQVYTGPFEGKAQTASPNAAGDQVAVLVRKRPMGAGPGSMATATRCTMMHDVFLENVTELDHHSAISRGRTGLIPPHPHDLAHCPSAVGLSPSGDCVVAIHRRALTVLLEVLIRTAPGVFVSAQTIDVTPWTTIGRGEPSVFDPPGTDAVANALKLPYHVTFSPCGRFAAVVDQRTLFGLSVTNHALVVLDMALRHERRGVRALPLAPSDDVAPRSLEWTSEGIWLQPRYGCLFLKTV